MVVRKTIVGNFLNFIVNSRHKPTFSSLLKSERKSSSFNVQCGCCQGRKIKQLWLSTLRTSSYFNQEFKPSDFP